MCGREGGKELGDIRLWSGVTPGGTQKIRGQYMVTEIKHG